MKLDGNDIRDKNAIVIGASDKGLARAEELLSSGVRRLVLADGDADRLHKGEERLGARYHDRIRYTLCRTNSKENWISLLMESLAFFEGSLDMVFNEEGGPTPDSPLTLDRSYYAGKTAVVTGAASGIGLAIIEELLACGAEKVVLADFNAENLETHTARLSGQYPGKVKGALCNVTIEREVAKTMAEATDFFGGRLDLLVNNAGAGMQGLFTAPSTPMHFDENGPLAPRVQSNEDWKRAFDLNFYGALYGCRAAIPIMQRQGGGQIINVISGIAFYPMAYQSMYAATKAALNGLTLSLRTEYWDDGIRISSATPGTTVTGIWSGKEPPKTAQTPQQSARRILSGACHNRRVIFGDDADASGSTNCFHIDYEDFVDSYLLDVARKRRAGVLAV